MAVGSAVKTIDAVVVGAGFAGMYMLYRLRERGMSTQVFEAGDGVGGTWYWNRYPGARCDVESMEYQFGFSDELQRGWTWSERYPTQPEVMRYMNYVADSLDLRRDIQFNTRVVSAIFDETDRRWTITADRGDQITAKYCIMATGCLSTASIPSIPGLEQFSGEWHHTGNWPHEGVELAGKRVGVIGTGSSGIQVIPVIAEQAASLTVFQRTANFSLPAFNRALTRAEIETGKRDFMANRRIAEYMPAGTLHPPGKHMVKELPLEEVNRELEARWQMGGFAFLSAFQDMLTDIESNEVTAEFVRRKIREVVKDPEVADLLTPTDHPLGTKRLCIDTNYFETYNLPHVRLVDVRKSPIERITTDGIVAGDKTYELDVIVFATGFDAMTGALSRIDIRGRQGMNLRDKWEAGPRNYLGIATAGFPNLFLITGPGSPSVLTAVILAIEQHVEWIAACIDHMRASDVETIEPELEAENAWVQHVNDVAFQTLMPLANSWYMGANIPGKPRIFMPYVGGLGTYRTKCAEIAEAGYAGFKMSR